MVENYKRYVIRKIDDQKYYGGSGTNIPIFHNFKGAKLFKTRHNAETSCSFIKGYNSEIELEIVEVEVSISLTDNVIKYK